MITENDVLRSYTSALRLRARQMEIEKTLREESPIEFEERIDAIAEHATLELQYIAQFTY